MSVGDSNWPNQYFVSRSWEILQLLPQVHASCICCSTCYGSDPSSSAFATAAASCCGMDPTVCGPNKSDCCVLQFVSIAGSKAMTSAWCCFYWAKWATYSILVTEAVVAAGCMPRKSTFSFPRVGVEASYGSGNAKSKPQRVAHLDHNRQCGDMALPCCLWKRV